MSRLILGIATNSKGEYKACVDGKYTKAYKTWHNMLHRAYCPKYQAKYPTYIGCEVSEEWLEFQQFVEWYENNEYSDYGYTLDKDLLIPGNKLYAPERCVFVPQQLNKLLNDHGAAQGQHPQGVCFKKGHNKFGASIRIDGKKKGLGYFDTEIEAYLAYKKAKEENVKRMANHWRGNIATNVYEALMNWQLEETP